MRLSVYVFCLFGLLLICEAAQSPQRHWRQYHPKSLGLYKNVATAKIANATTLVPTTSKVTTPGPTTSKVTTPGPTTSKVTTPGPTTSKVTTPGPTTSKVTTPGPTTSKVTTPGPTTSKTPHTTPKPTPPHCTPGQKIAVNGTCRNFIECDKSFKWVNMTCSTWCHNFNPATAKCDWSWKYRCVDPTTASPCTANDVTTTQDPVTTSAPPVTTSAPPVTTSAAPVTTSAAPVTTTAAPVTTSAPQTTTSTTPTPTTTPPCSNGTKKVFKAGDCKDYLECDSGKWVKKSCSFGYDFDVNKLACTWSWWAKC